MISTRLKNPLHNLTQTAKDAASYLRHVSEAEFIDTLKEVGSEYGAVTESYVWYWFYWRERLPALKKTISDLEAKQKQNNETIETNTDQLINEENALTQAQEAVSDELSIINAMVALLKEENAGLASSSRNTILLKKIIKKLHGYDPSIKLQLNEVVEFHQLLIDAIEERLKAEAELNEEEIRLIELEHKVLALQLEKNICESELRKIEEDRINQESELEKARQTLLLLNPEFDIKQFALGELKETMEEAKKVGEAAVNTFIAERNELLRKKQELANIRGNVALAKSQLIGQTLGGVGEVTTAESEKEKIVSEKKKRQDELELLRTERKKQNQETEHQEFKSLLSNFLLRGQQPVVKSGASNTTQPLANEENDQPIANEMENTMVTIPPKPRVPFHQMKVKTGMEVNNTGVQNAFSQLNKLYQPKSNATTAVNLNEVQQDLTNVVTNKR